MTTLEIIRTIAPEFEPMGDGEVEKWIELARPFVSAVKFGRAYEQALAYMTCHKMKMGGKGEDSLAGIARVAGNLGIASISEGSSSISFSANQAGNLSTDAEYALTNYGLQYLQLRKLFVVPITVAK